MDVIKFVISEDDCKLLGQEGMSLLSALNTPIVLNQVMLYLNNKDADPEVQKIVSSVYYEDVLAFNARTNPLFRHALDTLGSLKLSKVHFDLTLEEMREIKQCISTLNGLTGKTKPYRSPVKTGDFQSVVAAIKDMKGCSYIATKLNKNKSIFLDATNARAVGTNFKTVTYKAHDIKLVEEGIDFLIKMKEEDIPPKVWRHL